MSDTVFSYRTRGGSSPENKPKVFFTCHPDDLSACFDSICNDILESHDCAIFYTKDMSVSLSDPNVQIVLERMNLFVIPVTYILLSTDNRAMDVDFRFAQNKNIPVLPLLMESGIGDLYCKPDRFGELQYLNPNCKDLTAIDYKDKLGKYLSSVLIDDGLAQRIRLAFDAYIFLSYRKKDRKYANELMKLIHKNPECEDIAIWFDEFLTPGESFRKNIETVLNNSKLFALLVTPSILERHSDGSPNFIMKEEYPAAKKLGITILPAEMEKTNNDKLRSEFIDMPECSNTNDEPTFRKRLLDSLVGIAISENNDDPEHLYLIGLAYLMGIDVEIDVGRGVRLVRKAAEAELLEAVNMLMRMYRYGYYVQLDYQVAKNWAQKEYEIRSRNDGDNCEDTLNALSHYASLCLDTGDYKYSLELNKKLFSICTEVLGDDHPLTLLSINNLATSYSNLGE